MAALARALIGEQTVLGGLLGKLTTTFKVWDERVQARRELAELTFRDIQDIGLDQAEVDREIAKPFWIA